MHTLSLRCGLAVLCINAAALTACNPSDTLPPATAAAAQIEVYDMRGVIERLGTDIAPRQLIIRHESTKDMDSMAMPFFIDDAVLLTGLAVGDKVSFRFEIDLKSRVEHVTKCDKLPADTALKISEAATTSTVPATGMMKGMSGM